MFIHKFVAFLVVTCIATLYAAWAWGIVLFHLWDMNIITVFPNMPQITQAQAIGVALTFSIFKNHELNLDKDEETTSDKLLKLATAITLPWITLSMGVIIHLLML